MLPAPLFVLLFWWLVLALGRRALQLCAVSLGELTDWERASVHLAVGTGLTQFVPYALGAAGVLSPTSVAIAFAVLALALSRDMIVVARSLWAKRSQLTLAPVSGPVLVWSALLAALLGMLLVRASVFYHFGDDDGYHLSAPKRWLASGTLHYLASYTHTNASMGFEMLYAVALSVSGPVGAKYLNFSTGLFCLLVLFLCARRIASTEAGLAAVALVLIPTPLINTQYIFPMAYADFAAGWMAAVCILLWLEYRERGTRKLLGVMALCAGFAGSVKFTSLAVAISWAPIVALHERRASASWAKVVLTLVRFGSLAALPVLPWLGRNWVVTGNPVYPMLSSVIPTADWTAKHAAVFSRYIKYYSWGIASGARLGEGQRQALLVAGMLIVLVAGGFTIHRVKNALHRELLAFATLFTVISIALVGLIFRYCLPALLAVSLVVTARLAGALATKSWRAWPATALMALALWGRISQWKSEPNPHPVIADLKVAVGLSSYEAEFPDDVHYKMWSFINRATAGDSRILMAAFYAIFGASSFGGFPVDRACFTTDSHLQTYFRLDDWNEFLKSIQRSGVTHVVIVDLPSSNRHGFVFEAAENEIAFSRRLADEFGSKVVEFGDLKLYAIERERLGQSAATSPTGYGATLMH